MSSANEIVSEPSAAQPVPAPESNCGTFGGWFIECRESHIMKSKCSKSQDVCVKDDPDPCPFCLFSQQLELPHLPDMVFPENLLRLTHKETNYMIEFNPLDALKQVDTGKLGVRIACADEWVASRADDPHVDKVAHPFDWTFSTDYSGTLRNGFTAEPTEKRIDLAKLKQREQILYYKDVTLFEDELHDNGTVLCSAKIRVMPSGFYILHRLFLRVDDVMVRLNDARYHHEFENDFVLREYTSQEAKVEDLKVSTSVLTDPNEVSQILPFKTKKYEILRLTKPEANAGNVSS